MSFTLRQMYAASEPRCQTSSGSRVTCSSYVRWKSYLGRICGALLLIPALPVIGFLVALVRLTSPGPGLYRQVRVGRNGQPFFLYKIRTMRVDAEAKTGPVWTALNDPRVTRVGRILRKVHLDELPQLFNVVRGEMALIGPRPERPEFTQYLAREIPGYMDRCLVPPGITGLAQINLPPDTDVENVRRKLVLDMEYVRTASLSLDLRILLCTSMRLIGLPGMGIAKLLGLVRLPEGSPRSRPATHSNGAPAPYRARLANSASGRTTGKKKKKKKKKKNGFPSAYRSADRDSLGRQSG